MVEDLYESTKQCARRLGRHESYVRKLCREGRLPGAIKRGCAWYIPRHATVDDIEPVDDKAREYLTVEETATLLRCSETWVRQMLQSGQLRGTRLPWRAWLVHRADLRGARVA